MIAAVTGFALGGGCGHSIDARRVAALPPLSVRMAKRAITAIATANNAAATYMDADQYALAALSDDHREAVAAFFEKRPARFTGS